MRKLVLFISSIGLLLLGCSNAAYEQAMEEGLVALDEQDYAKAEVSFTRALDEKADDKEAEVLLRQTEYIQVATMQMENGDLDRAAEALEEVISIEEGSILLINLAKEFQEEIDALHEKFEAYLDSYEEAKKKYDNEEYDTAIETLERILVEDIDHIFFTQLKLDVENLLAEVQAAKDAAILAAKEEEQMVVSDEGIGEFAGYWLNEDNNISCHITSAYMHCAMPYSDFITHHEIRDIKHISATEVEITNADETPVILKLSNNNETLHTPAYTYKRVSKEEANAIFDGHYELQ
ncbi:hypothetical protein [Pseudogracilibacillus sp. SO30301A]|uniref:hypothetical protein n=1 Tax=Pseudogracilibacillus sp. SO30301A TaxID=3098291 RepID=UPI00300E4F08